MAKMGLRARRTAAVISIWGIIKSSVAERVLQCHVMQPLHVAMAVFCACGTQHCVMSVFLGLTVLWKMKNTNVFLPLSQFSCVLLPGSDPIAATIGYTD